ncbi:MAG: hypothetical protein H7141_08845, partial [Burkholderiales bacterium]|nr:hypothetical protein [Bacteroidia bacterium]
MKIIYCRFLIPLFLILSHLTANSAASALKSKNLIGVIISGNVIRDGNGLVDNQISGTGTGNTDGIPLIAYLVDANNNIIDKTNVLAGGSFTFNQVPNGSFTVAISTNNVTLGSNLSTIPANIPAGWNAVGESYGIGNSQNGFEIGVPNLRIAVVVTNPNKNILAVNFALDQSPIVSNDFFTTFIDTNFDIPVLANDTDPNGNTTINKTTLLLFDPVDNFKKSTVTVVGQGIYTINPTTGNVNFNPEPTYIGAATKIKYTVKDDAGIESNEGVISLLVKPVGVNDAGITAIDVPIITIVKANDGNSAIGTTVSIAIPPATGSVVVNPDGSITYTPVPGDKGIYTYTYLLNTVDGVTSDPVTVTVAVGINPAISLLKTNVFNDTNGDGAAQVGETITYAFTVTNTGDVAVTGTTITDPKVSFVNVALVPANLGQGETGTLSAVYTITQSDIDAGSVSNTAVATAKDPIDLPVTDVSGTTNNNNTPTVIVVSQNPSISLLKTSVL